jgi:hypothetical protein
MDQRFYSFVSFIKRNAVLTLDILILPMDGAWFDVGFNVIVKIHGFFIQLGNLLTGGLMKGKERSFMTELEEFDLFKKTDYRKGIVKGKEVTSEVG